jgi:hypothetical protein
MSQSSMLVAALLAAFVVYLAMNNRLAVYWSILAGSAAGAGTGTAAPAASGSAATTGQQSSLLQGFPAQVPVITGIG